MGMNGQVFPAAVGVGPIGSRGPALDRRDFVIAAAQGIDGTFGDDGQGRYVVGGAADSVVLRATATPAQRVASAADFLAAHPGETVGVWTDSETSRTWLDVVTTHADEAGALAVARERGELAIYDRYAGVVIDV